MAAETSSPEASTMVLPLTSEELVRGGDPSSFLLYAALSPSIFLLSCVRSTFSCFVVSLHRLVFPYILLFFLVGKLTE